MTTIAHIFKTIGLCIMMLTSKGAKSFNYVDNYNNLVINNDTCQLCKTLVKCGFHNTMVQSIMFSYVCFINSKKTGMRVAMSLYKYAFLSWSQVQSLQYLHNCGAAYMPDGALIYYY